jgi:hypothetical protein
MTTELYAVEYPVYAFRVERIDHEGKPHSIWCPDLAAAFQYLRLFSNSELVIEEKE